VAQKKNAKPASNLKPFYWLIGLLLVAGVGALAWIVVRGKSSQVAIEPVAVEGVEDAQTLVAKAQGMTIGNDGAPGKMLVFSDFQCPFCASFATQIEPLLVSEFVQPGILQFVYYDFPLGGNHRHSFLVSRAARCANEQGKFWEYHNLALGKQSDWSFDQDPPIKKLIGYGSEVGLERGAFEACVNSTKYQDIVSANHRLGERLGVNSTPTVFVNSKRLPPEIFGDIKALRELINAEAASSGAAPPTTTTE
jgi:protein-disulfide isomerase